MSSIYPIQANRSSDLLVQQRLLAQIQADQLNLSNLQTEISSGQKIQNLSDDPQAGMAAINLQSLLDGNTQSQTNLNLANSYLSSTDSAIGDAANIVTQMQALAVSAAQTTNSSSEQQSNVAQIQAAITQLTSIANEQFDGRYIFAGSQTNQQPFSEVNGYTLYSGNNTSLNTYGDASDIISSNISGTDVFGTYSQAPNSTADLNPVLTPETPLSELRNGQGISKGSIVVSDGTNSQTIDLSGATSIGDVAYLIEKNPPSGRTVTATVTSTGLNISLDAAGGGSLQIREVGSGTTAAELGIKNTVGTGISPIVGSALEPSLSLATPLSNLFGARPVATVSSTGSNNDLSIEAVQNGTTYNGASVQFVNDSLLHASPGLSAGNETTEYSATATPATAALAFSGLNNNLVLTGNVAGTSLNNVRIDVVSAGAIGNTAQVNYDASSQVLTIGIDSANSTTAQAVINAINSQGTFTATYDNSDPADGGLVPTATIPTSNARAGFGDTGNSGGNANTLFVNIAPGATTANDIINAINSDPTVGKIFSATLAGNDTTSIVSAGLGAVDVDSTGTLAGGNGTNLDQTSGFVINNGGQTYNIDISSAKSVQDVLNILNASSANVVASINPDGNGINVVSKLSGSDFSIGENGGTTATQLGIRTLTANTSLADLNYGAGINMIAGTNFTITRSDGTVANIALDPATDATVGDVINKINAAGGITASLTATGNGIQIQDNAGGTGPLTITETAPSTAAVDLGLIPVGQSTASVSGSPPVLKGTDPNPQEVDSIFNSLNRLQQAISTGDVNGIQRASALLGEDFNRMNFARANVGTQLQSVGALQTRLGNDQVQLQSSLSNAIDVNLPQVISDMTAEQASFEASLRLTAKVFQLSLLNYL